jgi:hypothetical protein
MQIIVNQETEIRWKELSNISINNTIELVNRRSVKKNLV